MRTVVVSLLLSWATLGAFAQAPTPAPQSPITVVGCVAPEQRDGSLGAKATGTMATPETAPMEANSPVPTGAFLLLQATPAGRAPKPESRN